jgi:hypothetical protein
MLADTPTTRLVKASGLGRHGTVFPGSMAEPFVETCFLAGARLLGNPEDLVCVKAHGLGSSKPSRP